MDSLYPPGTPSSTQSIRWSGWNSNDEEKNWERLNVIPTGIEYVQFGYATKAGLAEPSGSAGDVFPDLAGNAVLNFSPDQPWFVAQASGDIDGDGLSTYMTATSMTSVVFVENNGE
jgi:hypothetical protein